MISKQSCEYKVNTIIIGDSKVGKTSIINRLIHDKFSDKVDITLGVNYNVKLIDMLKYKVKFQLWDTSGLESYRAIGRSYYRDADIILLVFDLSKIMNIYSKLESWIEDFRSLNKNAEIYLIGNKMDLERKITTNSCMDFAIKYNLSYFECSAKNDININEIFISIINDLHKKKLLKKNKLFQNKNYYNNGYQNLELQDENLESNNDSDDKNSCLERMKYFRCFY